MIPLKLQPEPANFYLKVQQPGEDFLRENPHPTTNEFEKNNYWKNIIIELYNAYAGICAYSCHWIPHTTGSKTVEHFKPKSRYPQEAYRWENYRLVCGTLNGRKGNFEDVLDPFTLQDGWFTMDFPSLMVFPSLHLSVIDKTKVEKTIKRLKLNDENLLLERAHWLQGYIVGYPFFHLQKKAPFIAYELQRQNLDDKNHPIWAEYKNVMALSDPSLLEGDLP